VDEIDAAGLDEKKGVTVEEELEQAREGQQDLKRQIDVLRTRTANRDKLRHSAW
jgi:hypothetical protein